MRLPAALPPPVSPLHHHSDQAAHPLSSPARGRPRPSRLRRRCSTITAPRQPHPLSPQAAAPPPFRLRRLAPPSQRPNLYMSSCREGEERCWVQVRRPNRVMQERRTGYI